MRFQRFLVGPLAALMVCLLLPQGRAWAQSNNCSGGLNPCAQIQSVEDLPIGLWAPPGNARSDWMEHCVRVSGSAAAPSYRYRVSFSVVGLSTGGRLGIPSTDVGNTDILDFRVRYNDQAGSGNVTFINENDDLGVDFQGLTRTEQTTCVANGTGAQRLRIIIREVDIDKVKSGNYGGVLSILITPQ
jgi:hypothetical protein